MPVSELGWSTLVEAEAYFADERYETALWDAAAMTDDLKNKSLNMAYNRIYFHPDYSVPAAGAETALQHVKLIIIQCEMAYYFLVHLEAEDQRKGLQAQAVTDAGIVKEKYHKDLLDELPVPAMVEALLDEFDELGETTVMIAIDRDEDEDLDTDVVEEG